jgi:hypothetical protein
MLHLTAAARISHPSLNQVMSPVKFLCVVHHMLDSRNEDAECKEGGGMSGVKFALRREVFVVVEQDHVEIQPGAERNNHLGSFFNFQVIMCVCVCVCVCVRSSIKIPPTSQFCRKQLCASKPNSCTLFIFVYSGIEMYVGFHR